MSLFEKLELINYIISINFYPQILSISVSEVQMINMDRMFYLST